MNLLTLLAGSKYFNGKVGDASRIKLIRHSSPDDFDVERRFKYDSPYLEAFQAVQSTDLLKGCDVVLSFLRDQGQRAVFRGAWEVKGRITREQYLARYKSGKEVMAVEDTFNSSRQTKTRFDQSFYDTSSIDLLGDIADRLVIDWGKSAISWCQWLSEKEVIEILPANYVSEFPGHYDLILTLHELRQMISNPASNRTWHQQLSSVSAVYLILDTTTGKQYVGSAYGKDGLWGRWATYTTDPSGGNKLLLELLKENGKKHAEKFQFSILRVLERSVTREQVIRSEQVEKLKLGTRAFGLTLN